MLDIACVYCHVYAGFQTTGHKFAEVQHFKVWNGFWSLMLPFDVRWFLYKQHTVYVHFGTNFFKTHHIFSSRKLVQGWGEHSNSTQSAQTRDALVVRQQGRPLNRPAAAPTCSENSLKLGNSKLVQIWWLISQWTTITNIPIRDQPKRRFFSDTSKVPFSCFLIHRYRCGRPCIFDLASFCTWRNPNRVATYHLTCHKNSYETIISEP